MHGAKLIFRPYRKLFICPFLLIAVRALRLELPSLFQLIPLCFCLLATIMSLSFSTSLEPIFILSQRLIDSVVIPSFFRSR